MVYVSCLPAYQSYSSTLEAYAIGCKQNCGHRMPSFYLWHTKLQALASLHLRPGTLLQSPGWASPLPQQPGACCCCGVLCWGVLSILVGSQPLASTGVCRSSCPMAGSSRSMPSCMGTRYLTHNSSHAFRRFRVCCAHGHAEWCHKVFWHASQPAACHSDIPVGGIWQTEIFPILHAQTR